MKSTHTHQLSYDAVRAQPKRHGSIQNRAQNFGLTMIVMGAGFILYYLGLFGGVEGPLQPERIGDHLATMGFSDRHLLAGFLLLMVLALTWNWIYNAFNRLVGRRMICGFPGKGVDDICAETVVKRNNTGSGVSYMCAAGHQGSKVHLRVVKKGTVGHFLWMMWLIFSAIVFYYMK